MRSLGSKDAITRRELLGRFLLRGNLTPVIETERCTGCGLCAIRCPKGAITIQQNDEENRYQILFHRNLCDGCGRCEKPCPEHGFRFQRSSARNVSEGSSVVLFEDKMVRCTGCNTLLFPEALATRVKTKVISSGGSDLPLHLCPLCRMSWKGESIGIKSGENKGVAGER